MVATPTTSIGPASVGNEFPTPRRERIRILIADDSRMSCHLLKSALTRSSFVFDVVACAITRVEILQFLKTGHADIGLVSQDLADGPIMGFQVVNELRVSFPKTRVILLLKSVPDEMIVDAFRSGTKGVFCRTEPLPSLCKCIRSVHHGQIWANSKQLHLVLEALISATPLRAANFQGRSLLTKREDEVVNLVTDGLANRAIGQKLGITEHTVSNYLFKIYDKLGISSRVELVLYTLTRRYAQSSPT
jgi:two-component system nitrate/nitrite response regulator NarL